MNDSNRIPNTSWQIARLHYFNAEIELSITTLAHGVLVQINTTKATIEEQFPDTSKALEYIQATLGESLINEAIRDWKEITYRRVED